MKLQRKSGFLLERVVEAAKSCLKNLREKNPPKSSIGIARLSSSVRGYGSRRLYQGSARSRIDCSSLQNGHMINSLSIMRKKFNGYQSTNNFQKRG